MLNGINRRSIQMESGGPKYDHNVRSSIIQINSVIVFRPFNCQKENKWPYPKISEHQQLPTCHPKTEEDLYWLNQPLHSSLPIPESRENYTSMKYDIHVANPYPASTVQSFDLSPKQWVTKPKKFYLCWGCLWSKKTQTHTQRERPEQLVRT